MARTEPLSNVDAAWLSMDEPTNLMMVSGIMTFPKPIDIGHLLAVIKYRMLTIDRFRQRVVQSRMPLGAPAWELDPDFNIKAHIRRVALPAPGDQKALQDLASDLISTPLDPTKPLWQIHIVEDYGEGSAIIVRIHHSIADGSALVFVLLSLTDMVPNADWPEPVELEAGDEEGESPAGIGGLVNQVTSTVGSARSLTGKLVHESWSALHDTNHALELIQTGVDYSYAASKLLLRTTDPPTPFKGKLGVMKRVAWSNPLPLKQVKAIKNRTNATVNDVLISAVSGSLRRYMLAEQETPVDFRAMVPVNLRKMEEMGEMGNRFGLVLLSLPVSIEDPQKRLNEVNRRMMELKNSPEATVAMGFLNAMGTSPSDIQGLIMRTFVAKVTAVMTNVPGPPMPLYLAGNKIEDIMFWVPQAGRLGIGISILSYAGKVYLGVATDEGLIPDPDRIIDGFYEEYDILLKQAGMLEGDVVENEASPSAESTNAPATSTQSNGHAPRTIERPVAVAIGQDDLRMIDGIGPKTAELLENSGIMSLDQVAGMTSAELRTILDQAGNRYRHIDPSDWPAKAQQILNAR